MLACTIEAIPEIYSFSVPDRWASQNLSLSTVAFRGPLGPPKFETDGFFSFAPRFLDGSPVCFGGGARFGIFVKVRPLYLTTENDTS